MVSSEAVRRVSVLVAMFVLIAPWTDARGAKPRDAANFCAKAVSGQEAARRIPTKLLHAISIAESGRWDPSRRENVAWPWTVTAQGKGRFYPTKETAIRAVRSLRKRGVRNIDVGCMQINLRYHPDAFNSLQDAFDPVTNAAYGAAFLVKLRRERKSWTLAVKHYHSATQERHGPYRNKVYKIWREVRLKTRRAQIAALRAGSTHRRLSGDQRRAKLRRLVRMKSKPRRPLSVTQRLRAGQRLDARAQRWLDRQLAVLGPRPRR